MRHLSIAAAPTGRADALPCAAALTLASIPLLPVGPTTLKTYQHAAGNALAFSLPLRVDSLERPYLFACEPLNNVTTRHVYKIVTAQWLTAFSYRHEVGSAN